MANRLREQMHTADMLTVSGAEQRQLLEVIRERAQIAMLELTLLFRVFSDDTAASTMITDGNQYLPWFRKQFEYLTHPNQQTLCSDTYSCTEQLTSDLLAAVRLHTEVTNELTELMARSASAHSDLTSVGGSGFPNEYADSEWGPGGWRSRALVGLYGGDPLGTLFSTAPNAPRSENVTWGAYAGQGTPFDIEPLLTANLSAPEVQTLFGLARAADVLYLRREGSGVLAYKVNESGEFIWSAVEAYLRNQDCAADPGATCDLKADSPQIPDVASFEDTLLWNRYRITPDHGVALAKALAQGVPPPPGIGAAHGPFLISGPCRSSACSQEVTTVSQPPQLIATTPEPWDKLDKEVSFSTLPLAMRASIRNAIINYLLPNSFDYTSYASAQGFVARQQNEGDYGQFGLSNVAMRYLGAVPALAAVRDSLVEGNRLYPSSELYGITLSPIKEILGLIASSIGPSSVTALPLLAPVSVTVPAGTRCGNWLTQPANNTCTVLAMQMDGTNKVKANVELLRPTGSEPLKVALITGEDVQSLTGSIYDVRHIANIAIDSTYKSWGSTEQERLDRAELDALANSKGADPGTTLTAPDLGLARDIYTVTWQVNSNGIASGGWPVLLAFTAGSPRKYVVLADPFVLRTFNLGETNVNNPSTYVVRSQGGYYFGVGGSLGSLAGHLMERHPTDWKRPLVDGFGYPIDWTPPTTPELLAGAADPVAFYLAGAKEAAQTATTAVTEAVDTIVQESADAQRLQTARDRSTEISELEKEAVCGPEDCNPSMTSWPPPRSLGCPLVSTDAVFMFGIDNPLCTTLDASLAEVIPEHLLLLTTVTDQLDQEQPPSFSEEYSGGSLQTLAIAQWNAAKKIQRIVAEAAPRMSELWYAQAAARDNYTTAQAEIDAQIKADNTQHTLLEDEMNYRCDDPGLRIQAYLSMFTWKSNTVGRTDFSDGPAWIVSPGTDVTVKEEKVSAWNPASFYAWQDNCDRAKDALAQFEASMLPHLAESAEGARKNWLGAQKSSDEAIQAVISSAVTAVADLESASANIDQALAGLSRTESRIAMDAFVEQSGVTSQLAIARRYHDADMWRARALLESARRLSVAARRSIEARYNVDLSALLDDEPFVAAPSLWADEVYEYDLDPPSAVGLSRTGGSTSMGGIYPNKLLDYVTNLENFVRGYPVKRPTAAANGDTEVITLAGPGANESGSGTTTSGGASRWSFQCGENGPWLSNPLTAPEGGSTLNWTFEELTPPFKNHGFGGALDLTTFSGTLGATRAGVDGFALDANSDVVTTPPTTVGESTGGITISGWVNPRTDNAIAHQQVILKSYNVSGWTTPFSSIELGRQSGTGNLRGSVTLAGAAGGVQHPFATTTVVPLNKWSHIAATYDGYTLRLYFNGVEAGSLSLGTTPQPIDWGAHGPWAIAGNPGSSQRIDGWVGPIRVETVARTADDIAGYYQQGIPNTRASAIWWFDDAAPPFQSTGTLPSIPLSVALGSVSTAPADPTGSSAYFDGGSCLSSGDTANGATTSTISASAWIYPTNHGSGTNKVILKKGYGTTWVSPYFSVALQTRDGKVVAGINVGGASATTVLSPSAIPLNQWSHVGLNFDGTTLEVYVNGAMVASGTVAGPKQIDWGSQGAWMVGGNPISNSEFFNGWIAKLRVDPVSRPSSFFSSAYGRGLTGTCFNDLACDLQEDCCEDYVPSPFDDYCGDGPPTKARIEFHLDPWGREGEFFVHDPYTERHNVRWGRLAVNLVGTGIRDCARADDSLSCYAESFLRYNLSHAGPAWSTDYAQQWHTRPIPIGQIEGGKALATEEWLDPISNSWNQAFVSNVARQELLQRPVSGIYTLDVDLTPDVHPERIDRVQILAETEYWVRQR